MAGNNLTIVALCILRARTRTWSCAQNEVKSLRRALRAVRVGLQCSVLVQPRPWPRA